LKSRIRTIKPEFFLHEGLFDLEVETSLPVRVAFAGLWTCADREGRFRWRPRSLKACILPFDNLDFARVLDALGSHGFVTKYIVGDDEYGLIPSFTRHQVINNRESDSELPAPPEDSPSQEIDACGAREARVAHATVTPFVRAQVEGKGRERNGKEQYNPPTPFGSLETKTENLNSTDVAVAICQANQINGVKERVEFATLLKVEADRQKRDHVELAEEIMGQWLKHQKTKQFPQSIVSWLTGGHYKPKSTRKPVNPADIIRQQEAEQLQ
jgi:hypothetical protein